MIFVQSINNDIIQNYMQTYGVNYTQFTAPLHEQFFHLLYTYQGAQYYLNKKKSQLKRKNIRISNGDIIVFRIRNHKTSVICGIGIVDTVQSIYHLQKLNAKQMEYTNAITFKNLYLINGCVSSSIVHPTSPHLLPILRNNIVSDSPFLPVYNILTTDLQQFIDELTQNGATITSPKLNVEAPRKISTTGQQSSHPTCYCPNCQESAFRDKKGNIYTESHHFVPDMYRATFGDIVDQTQIPLCPYHHKLIHYGNSLDMERTLAITNIYNKMKPTLNGLHINVSLNDMLEIYNHYNQPILI